MICCHFLNRLSKILGYWDLDSSGWMNHASVAGTLVYCGLILLFSSHFDFFTVSVDTQRSVRVKNLAGQKVS
jgi:hypothetical protein